MDSTPDLSHVDQLTFIFSFVDPDGHVVERFLAFEPIESHTGQSLADCILAMFLVEMCLICSCILLIIHTFQVIGVINYITC